MGTRADFYIGNDPQTMEWLGSIAHGGYDIAEVGPDADRKDCAVAYSKTPEQYRAAVMSLLADRDSATTPTQGWPWPWNDSQTTDFAYCFVGQEVLVYEFGYGPRRIGERSLMHEEEDEGMKAPFPDMSAHKNVTFGKRSGLLMFGQRTVSAMPFDTGPILYRYNAVQDMLKVVRRLVETATFTLSAEDYTALETALRDYDNANSDKTS